jgi:hypothetical protein
MMPSAQLVYAVLAAQAAVLRDHITGSSEVDMLFRSTDMLEQLTSQIAEVATDQGRAEAAAQAAGAIGGMLDNYAFMQAQRLDTVRQMADCIVTALQRLATPDPLSADDIADLYCCEDQRLVHEQVIREFAGNTK